MKEQGLIPVVACRPMAAVSATSLVQTPYPTPSPFSFSVASSRWSSRSSIDRTSLILRSLAFLLSFLSLVLLASTSSKKNDHHVRNFTDYPKLMYCFVVHVLVFMYSAFQLSKGVCDISQRCVFISDMVSDYTTLVLDQMTSYALASSCPVAVSAVQHISRDAPLWNASVASASMLFATLLVFAACSNLSGYKLCKRIIW